MCFSLKESFFKAVFPRVGHYFDFHAVSILDIDMVQKTIRFRLNQYLSPEFCQGLVLTGFFAAYRKYHSDYGGITKNSKSYHLSTLVVIIK
ncbi:MAG: 4'-phosphopantetheinyl transferase superfamily protein [Exilibacterium sp.]